MSEIFCLCLHVLLVLNDGWGYSWIVPVQHYNPVHVARRDIYEFWGTDVPLYPWLSVQRCASFHQNLQNTHLSWWHTQMISESPFWLLEAQQSPRIASAGTYSKHYQFCTVLYNLIFFLRDSKVSFINRSEIPLSLSAIPSVVSNLFKSSFWGQHLDLHWFWQI